MPQNTLLCIGWRNKHSGFNYDTTLFANWNQCRVSKTHYWDRPKRGLRSCVAGRRWYSASCLFKYPENVRLLFTATMNFELPARSEVWHFGDTEPKVMTFCWAWAVDGPNRLPNHEANSLPLTSRIAQIYNIWPVNNGSIISTFTDSALAMFLSWYFYAIFPIPSFLPVNFSAQK
jgi:hypothetical protein